jgi:hypothetical protein
MLRWMLVAIALGLVAGLAASSVWGPLVGTGAGVLLVVVAAVFLVLRRNQADLKELEEGRLPEGSDRVLGGEEDRGRKL